MEKLFSVTQFEECGRGRIEDHGVAFEGDKADCEKFVEAQMTIASLHGDPCGIFFEIGEAD